MRAACKKNTFSRWLAALHETAVVLVVIVGVLAIAVGCSEVFESLGPLLGSILDERNHGWN